MNEKQPQEDTTRLVKVMFKLDPDDWHGIASETVWAEPMGNGRYRLRNNPSYMKGLSVEDIILAHDDGTCLLYAQTVVRGGHSTYHIRTEHTMDSDKFSQYWTSLQQLGCSFEEGAVLAVDVPPYVDIYEAYTLLEKGELAGIWDFEEGHCGHPLVDDE